MVKFESKRKALQVIEKVETEILTLIKDDLTQAEHQDISLDAWMNHFHKDEKYEEKYHTLCALEMALIDAQLFVEHQEN